MGKGVWGIDVSKYSIKAVRLEPVRDTLALTALDVVQYASAGTGEAGALDDQIRETLAELKKNHRIGSEPVVLSLPGHSTFNRLIKLPPVEDAKIPEVVKYEAQSQIPFNIDEVIWDFQLVQRAYNPGEEKEVILFAIKKDIVEQFLQNILPTGLKIAAIQFGPVAMVNFLSFDQDLGGAAAIALDLGSDNTDLIVLDGARFWVRNLSITGNDITRTLQKAFNVSFSEAEQLKLKAGQSPNAQKIFNAIQPILRDLVGDIHRSIGWYKSVAKQVHFDRVLLMGNGTKTLNFSKFISQSLQLPAARIQKLNQITVGPIDQGLLNNALPSLGTALGLALQGLDRTANRVNLLPPAYLHQREMGKKRPFFVGIAASLFLLVGLLYMQASAENEALTNLSNRATTVNTEYDRITADFATVRDLKEVEEKLDRLATIPSERKLIFDVLDHVNRNVPKNDDRNLPDEQKIWILKWTFAERSATKETNAPIRPLPAKRILDVELQVALSKRDDPLQAGTFVVENLLNWDEASGQPRDPAPTRGCIVQKYGLKTDPKSDRRYSVSTGKHLTELKTPGIALEAGGGMGPGTGTEDEVERFTQVLVTFTIPIGEENRKTEAPPPPEEPKTEENPEGQQP